MPIIIELEDGSVIELILNNKINIISCETHKQLMRNLSKQNIKHDSKGIKIIQDTSIEQLLQEIDETITSGMIILNEINYLNTEKLIEKILDKHCWFVIINSKIPEELMSVNNMIELDGWIFERTGENILATA